MEFQLVLFRLRFRLLVAQFLLAQFRLGVVRQFGLVLRVRLRVVERVRVLFGQFVVLRQFRFFVRQLRFLLEQFALSPVEQLKFLLPG